LVQEGVSFQFEGAIAFEDAHMGLLDPAIEPPVLIHTVPNLLETMALSTASRSVEKSIRCLFPLQRPLDKGIYSRLRNSLMRVCRKQKVHLFPTLKSLNTKRVQVLNRLRRTIEDWNMTIDGITIRAQASIHSKALS
jgi:hypothetical protein